MKVSIDYFLLPTTGRNQVSEWQTRNVNSELLALPAYGCDPMIFLKRTALILPLFREKLRIVSFLKTGPDLRLFAERFTIIDVQGGS
jgi:hypothetical protein